MWLGLLAHYTAATLAVWLCHTTSQYRQVSSILSLTALFEQIEQIGALTDAS